MPLKSLLGFTSYTSPVHCNRRHILGPNFCSLSTSSLLILLAIDHQNRPLSESQPSRWTASTKMKFLTATLFLLVSFTTSSRVVHDVSPSSQASGSVQVISHTNNDTWSLGDASNSSGGKDNLRGTIDRGSPSSSSSSSSSSSRRIGCNGCTSGEVKVVGDMWSLTVFGAISLVGVLM
jgi:hypothetical protein